MSTIPCVGQSHGFSSAIRTNRSPANLEQQVQTPDAGLLCSNCVYSSLFFLSWGNFLVTQKMYYDHGVNKRVYICGAADSICLREIRSVVIFSCKSIRCLSYSGGILSEGDKRDSKGDMPRPFSSRQYASEREQLGRGYFAPEPASRTRPRRICRPLAADSSMIKSADYLLLGVSTLD